jgi:hypothetical protein
MMVTAPGHRHHPDQDQPDPSKSMRLRRGWPRLFAFRPVAFKTSRRRKPARQIVRLLKIRGFRVVNHARPIAEPAKGGGHEITRRDALSCALLDTRRVSALKMRSGKG